MQTPHDKSEPARDAQIARLKERVRQLEQKVNTLQQEFVLLWSCLCDLVNFRFLDIHFVRVDEADVYLVELCSIEMKEAQKPMQSQNTSSSQYEVHVERQISIPMTDGTVLRANVNLVDTRFGELLKHLVLPENWREIIRRNMVAEALKAGVTPENVEREKERLKLKRHRILKQHREGYIDDEEFQGEMATVELAIGQLDAPEVEGITYDEVIEVGEHLPGMAALWDEIKPSKILSPLS